MNNNNNYQIAHGFGATPRLVLIFLKCIISDRDYAVNDVVCIQDSSGANGSTPWANDTFVGTIIENSPNIKRKVSGFGSGSIVWNNWHLIIRAWK
jgi:hypothetical protein